MLTYRSLINYSVHRVYQAVCTSAFLTARLYKPYVLQLYHTVHYTCLLRSIE